MTTKLTKKETSEYQAKIDEMRRKVMYAENYTPHKVQYYRYLLIELLNNAPVGCR
jgi:hypothetical protein